MSLTQKLGLGIATIGMVGMYSSGCSILLESLQDNEIRYESLKTSNLFYDNRGYLGAGSSFAI